MAAELGCRMGQVEQMIRYASWNSGCWGSLSGYRGCGLSACSSILLPGDGVGQGARPLPAHIGEQPAGRSGCTRSGFCAMLGMEHRVISIDPMLAAFATLPGFVESLYLLGNLMTRYRMTVLYYHANRVHRLVCGTSNRSECMLGYCTSTATTPRISSLLSTCTRPRSTRWQKR